MIRISMFLEAVYMSVNLCQWMSPFQIGVSTTATVSQGR
jgi:hypothetical protein